MRTKEFGAIMFVRSGLPPSIDEQVRAHLRRVLDAPQTGPRGGTYLPFGDITEDTSEDSEAWDRNQRIFRARRMGKYVRPKR